MMMRMMTCAGIRLLLTLALFMLSQQQQQHRASSLIQSKEPYKFHAFLTQELVSQENAAIVAVDMVDDFFWQLDGGLLFDVGTKDGISLAQKLAPLGWQAVRVEGLFYDEQVRRVPQALSELRRSSGRDHINVLTLGVDSNDLAVLRSITWDTASFDVIIIYSEENQHADEFCQRARKYLNDKGYVFLSQKGDNIWFKRLDFRPVRNELYQNVTLHIGNRFSSQSKVDNVAQNIEQNCLRHSEELFLNFSRDNSLDYDSDQDGEPLDAIELFFWSICGGVVLDVGALDGQMYSQSAALLPLGWKRVLIEGSPFLGPKQAWYSPDAISTTGTICEYNKTVHFKNNRQYGGVLEDMTQHQRQTFHPDLTDHWTQNSMVFVVNCIPMRYVLKRIVEESGISHINLLLLDLEGSELTVLKTFDWKFITIDVIVVECERLFRPLGYSMLVRKFLVAQGYSFVGRRVKNLWFVRKGFKASVKPGRIGFGSSGHSGANASRGLQYPLVAEKKALHIDNVDPMSSKLIPRRVWIASCKGITPLVKENTEKIKKSSPNWEINVFDCFQQREFILDNFGVSSGLLWAYDLINDKLQAAKSDIWRLAVLYLKGGMYIDIDAYITKPLDEIILHNDSMLIAFEEVLYVDQYNSWYHLSNLDGVSVSDYPCTNRSHAYLDAQNLCIGMRYYDHVKKLVAFPSKKSSEVILTQWMLFSKPGHPFLLRAMENILEMIKLEFNCNSVINSTLIPSDYPMQRLFMITGPWAITATIRELIRGNESNKKLLRVADNYYFWDYQAKHERRRTYFKHMRIGQQKLLKIYNIDNGGCVDVLQHSSSISIGED